MKPNLLDLLVDPVERQRFHFDGRKLIAANGVHYPVVEGIPVLLRSDVDHTHRAAVRSLRLAGRASGEAIDLLSAVNLSDDVREQIRSEVARGADLAEAVIRRLIPVTNGLAYRSGPSCDEIPVPRFPQAGAGELLLDLGRSWGRWTIAAARAGFRTIGIDSSLGPLLAAKSLARQRGEDIDYVCGDIRFMPFEGDTFDRVFCHSTLQHFTDPDCLRALADLARVLKPNGTSAVQMANRAGVRSMWHQARRGFKVPGPFEVNYRSLAQLRQMFETAIGPTTISVDCFFGLGLQASDLAYMRPLARAATIASERLKRAQATIPPLLALADSVFCHSLRITRS